MKPGYPITCIDPPAGRRFLIAAVRPEVVLFLAADACCLNQLIARRCCDLMT
jgi:hypothetical protein